MSRISTPDPYEGRTLEEIFGVDVADKIALDIKSRVRVVRTKNIIRVYKEISPEERLRRSRVMIGRYAGDKNYFWNGGKSKEKYGLEFTTKLKETVRTRDNRMCAECGIAESSLNYRLCVHHIDSNKKNNIADNLISLCRSCHSKAHWGGEDWEEYFKKKIEEKKKCRYHR